VNLQLSGSGRLRLRYRGPLPGQRHAIRTAAVLVLVATVASCTWLLLQPPPELAAPPGFTDRPCPVASCAAYPVPSGVRGITIATLQNWVLYTRSAEAEIRAAGAWHVNLVRLQIVQDKMVGAGGESFSSRYMNAVRAIAYYALQRGLFVVLNAQTELSLGFVHDEAMPTAATYAFWRHMITWYGHNPRVVFDLFNEPRDCGWGLWRADFQPLVNYVRAHGSVNQLWVEGIDWGSTLAGVPLLRGQGIVYSFHHPGSPWPWQTPVTVATWDQAFGNLAARGVPVVDGEFVNFMGGYYWPRSTQMVTRYFEYLSYHRIGVVGWSLQPGVMTATTNETTAVSEPQGAGRLFMRYFWGRLDMPAAVRTVAAGEGMGGGVSSRGRG
jgi:cellulase (glycosyl hydrolase family 5)